ncbi:MAG: carbamoyl-phosphate synthase large subunit [Rickettsiales bacterium]|jgi:carbamoyl-phosphate synthase large subunit|nr:carbamoyl-phosphate synthase large subunit [Rickettsiales bacterium]
MPRRTDLKTILVVGAGPIVIGQACEFDYSGTQACKALKEEGYRVVLINSNPATIMTDPKVADRTYIEPITTDFIEQIIKKEKPDAILPTVGGQTALNATLALHDAGILDKYNIETIGANIDAINKAENRQLFNIAMEKIGLKTPRNAIVKTLEEALEVIDEIKLPAIIRPSFTMGGAGGGIVYTMEEYKNQVKLGLSISPISEIQIDQSVLGWKEYEMEVVRDRNDNAIIICSIENIDPMGVHTGDSITVAPALTLTDKEYQIMRNASIAVLREIGVETGGSNVQFAVNPKDGELLVIEMNPRVSRSSALASKATGFPIAKIAAKLAIGYSLDELKNDITKVTPASFEPTIDYVVTKIPRFTFEKFTKTSTELSSCMKSVGEAMAIGRNFTQSLQKALRSLETGLTGLDELEIEGYEESQSWDKNYNAIKSELQKVQPNRLLYIAQAMRYKMSIKEIQNITLYDPWFLGQIKSIIDLEDLIKHSNVNDKSLLLKLKKHGFSDKSIAKLKGIKEEEVTKYRKQLDITPVFKKVDTCAAEFKSFAPYFYSSYEGNIYTKTECEANPTDKKKIIILGGGPNRIGQGIEFDYACCHAAFALSEVGYETIMINCNPETVSTDYDTSDRLYFEPLNAEDVIEVIKKEEESGELTGVIVQFGGQTPLKLCSTLQENNIKVIGTSPDMIDLAEDRERFKALLEELNLYQPESAIIHNINQLKESAARIGFPVVVRPSYVLGGRAMEIIESNDGLDEYVKCNKKVILEGPILIDKFLSNAIEFDVDALGDGENIKIAAILEHIEEAGIHSGDSACSIPPYSVGRDVINLIQTATESLGKSLNIKGLMNIQFAYQNDKLYVIEVNPRSSRTVPFVAKATSIPVAAIAAKLMVGAKLRDFDLSKLELKNKFAVKEAIFPFDRFENVDILLGPEMKSTGEVMGLASSFAEAFAKAQIAVYHKLPAQGAAFISVRDEDKESILDIVKQLQSLNFNIVATKGTKEFLKKKGLKGIKTINKVKEGSPHIVDMINAQEIHLVINTTSEKNSILDSYSIRRATLINKVVYFTTIRGANALMGSYKHIKQNVDFELHCLQDDEVAA